MKVKTQAVGPERVDAKFFTSVVVHRQWLQPHSEWCFAKLPFCLKSADMKELLDVRNLDVLSAAHVQGRLLGCAL